MIKETVKDFFKYLVVGAIATLVEWILFYLLNTLFSIHYIAATTIAYIISTFSNWFFGRVLVFEKSEKGPLAEIASIYAASVIGLLLNVLIMWVAVSGFGIAEMLSKVIATGLVFMYNFIIRKLVIYKKPKEL